MDTTTRTATIVTAHAATPTDTINVLNASTTAVLNGQRGTLIELHKEPRPGTTGPWFVVIGAFVRLDGPHDHAGRFMTPGPMLYVTLREEVRSAFEVPERDVTGWRVIDRDEFDRLTGLDVLRCNLGWR